MGATIGELELFAAGNAANLVLPVSRSRDVVVTNAGQEPERASAISERVDRTRDEIAVRAGELELTDPAALDLAAELYVARWRGDEIESYLAHRREPAPRGEGGAQ